MINQLEEFVNNQLTIIRENNENPTKQITDLEFLRANIILNQLYPILLTYPNADLTETLEKIIYIECRQRGYEPADALKETKKQMEERKKNNKP